MQSPNRTLSALSVRLGFLWAVILPIVVAITITRGLLPEGCRAPPSPSEWWRWWSWPDGALAGLFVGLAAISAVTAFACVVRRASGDTAARAALWVCMGIGSVVWLLLNVVLFRSMHCSAV